MTLITKFQLQTRVSINATPEAVFKYLKHLKYHYLWNPPQQTIEPIISLKKGSQYKTTSVILGKKLEALNTVTKFRENLELELENTTGLVHFVVNFKLTGESGKTQLICNSILDSDSKAFAFAKPVLEVLARRELQTDLKALKIAVENQLS